MATKEHELLRQLDIFLAEQLDNGVFSESGIAEAVALQLEIKELIGDDDAPPIY